MSFYRRVTSALILLGCVAVTACAHQKKSQEAAQFADPVVIAKVYFETDHHVLKEAEQEKVRAQADSFQSDPKIIGQIEGYADERGSETYNLELGDRRARFVKKILVDLGVDPQRLLVISFGELKTNADRTKQEGLAENRRVDIKVR